jgi:3-oxoacyl-[acyl-carrier-protein] synthase-3
MRAVIRSIAHYLPESVLSNADLAAAFPEWTAEKILEKTGIQCRRISAEGECASDLGVAACRKLFDSGACCPEDIDFLILCTQSPDYFLPTTACLMQERLGLPTGCGALDFNLGCSGFVYGLGLAKGLIETGQAGRLLLVTAETYSKHIHLGDRSVRTLFGDAAAATLIVAEDVAEEAIGPFVYGTNGKGAENLIVPTGGMRQSRNADTAIAHLDDQGNIRSHDNLYMNGAEIYTFTLKAIPVLVEQMHQRAGIGPDEVDFYVFHQANQYMLESLRRKIRIPREKFAIAFEDCGNTVSSTIPIALQRLGEEGRLRPGQRVMLVGFGVGYSWGATMIRWA